MSETNGSLSQITVDAPTAEEALSEVQEQLGPNARIVDARKTMKGGIGGFFAREVFQLTAEPGDPGDGLSDVLRRVSASVDAEETTFGDVLRRELLSNGEPTIDLPKIEAEPSEEAEEVVSSASPSAPAHPTNSERDSAGSPLQTHSTPPAEVVNEARRSLSVPQGDYVAGTGPVEWSADRLARLGVPFRIVRATVDSDPGDDLAWLVSIATAIAPLCGPLPEGDSIAAGPMAARIGPAAGLATTTFPDPPSYGGPVALALDATDGAARAWLTRVQGDRWFHLVAGGEGWHDLAHKDIGAVSWTDGQAFIAAIQLCSDRRLPLAYGLRRDGTIFRATPLDVALSLREQLSRK